VKMTFRGFVSTAIVLTLALAAGAQDKKAAPAAKTPAKTTTAKTATKAPGAAFDQALLKPAALTAPAPAEFDVKFTTTKGEFTVHVTREWAPNGADRFYNLVKHHFYDNAAFFRNIKGFMVQFGLSAYPEVSAAWQPAHIKDDPVKQSNKPGYITYAMAGPNTRTTQLFINHGNNAGLDAQGFSPFGQVTSGMEVVEQLYDGYGEAPDQSQIGQKGKAYLEANFSKLDTIKSAVVVGGAATDTKAKAPAKTATKAPAKAADKKQ
jgi:peptidyl-prolyl cis-trans isomerase A (cyclophilin A)